MVFLPANIESGQDLLQTMTTKKKKKKYSSKKSFVSDQNQRIRINFYRKKKNFFFRSTSLSSHLFPQLKRGKEKNTSFLSFWSIKKLIPSQ